LLQTSRTLGSSPAVPRLMTLYVILSHRAPSQVARLTRTLLTGSDRSVVLVHHDQAVSRMTSQDLPASGRAHLVRFREGLRWGTWDLVDVVLLALRWATARVAFDWVVLLSGQDYPVRSPESIDAFLGASSFDVYASASPVQPNPETGWTPTAEGTLTRRYFYRWYTIPLLRAGPQSLTGKAIRYASFRATARQPFIGMFPFPDATMRFGYRTRRAPFSEAFRCFKGSQWFAASRHAVDTLLTAVENRPLVGHYRRAVIPDESFMQTVWENDPAVRVCSNDLRFQRWTAQSPHPDVLTSDQMGEALASGKHFARKFDIGVDARALDVIDRQLGFPRDR
jgi:hypothetical protein